MLSICGDLVEQLEALVIEAGTAFGSGAHPTTSYSLDWLGLLGPHHRQGRMLDVGCGSGILAIAAAKFHAMDVLASDLQAVAVAQTKHNAQHNHVAEKIEVIRADGLRHTRISSQAPYHLIFVNILYDVYLPWLPSLHALLERGGHLVLSGVLAWQEPTLAEACRAAKFDQYTPHGTGDWRACAMIKA